MTQREFDLVLMGATGFTGRLVAEHLAARVRPDGGLRWALAGRDRGRLEALREGLGDGLPGLVVADAHDRPSLDALARRTRVVLTTVGPYALHGQDLVAACAAAGTDCCDLTGEAPFMRAMIDEHGAVARASGARIVHCCGFDAVPSDLGVRLLQEEARRRSGAPLGRVSLRVLSARGGFSGGTVASMLEIVRAARGDRAVARLVRDPYALCPGVACGSPRQPPLGGVRLDPELGQWTAPFVMASLNRQVVHRSNALSGCAYGEDFLYDEAVVTGPGLRGRMRALGLALGTGGFALAAALGPTRALLRGTVLPDPGEGPDEEARLRGSFGLLLHGRTGDGRSLGLRVTGDRDPGYGATSRMVGEAALCLAEDVDRAAVPGGFWTPATALGEPYLRRLEAHAGLAFSLSDRGIGP